MKNQTGARYLYRLTNRKDESFNGIIKLANRVSMPANHKPSKKRRIIIHAQV